jgi:hypothetical protein
MKPGLFLLLYLTIFFQLHRLYIVESKVTANNESGWLSEEELVNCFKILSYNLSRGAKKYYKIFS